ncbi:MAG: M15 family metallopeptidase, partial [Bacteroidota bacterium]
FILDLILGSSFLLFTCQSPTKEIQEPPKEFEPMGEDRIAKSIIDSVMSVDTLTLDTVHRDEREITDSLALLEKRLEGQGLVDVQELSPDIKISLKYATSDNFLEEDVYYGLRKCYLQPVVAEMLAKAQEILRKLHPQVSLLVFDGVRPQSVQFRMWNLVKGTDQQNYVAEPNRGSLHNFGAAVDLGLHHRDTGVLDMGTSYDYFGALAQPRYEGKFLESGELSLPQVENRRLLRTVMNRAGFTGILNEWWHFNAFPKEEIRERFEIVR